VWRGLGPQAAADYEVLEASGFFARAVAAGRIVATERVDRRPDGLDGAWTTVLRHDRVPVVTYPYEWSFEMLRDAARLHLDLVGEALAEDLITKDASAYNLQFVGSRPVFIDVGSFERLAPGEPWYGYRQFCMHFLFPLMLQAYKGLPFQRWLRSDLEGITPAEARAALSRWDVLSPRRRGTLIHVALHARAEARYADTERDIGDELKRSGLDKAVVAGQIKGLRRLVERIRLRRSDSAWSTYGDRAHYTDADLEAKERFVVAVAAERRPATVWDLGANDGRFSRLVADHAGYVVAVDGDHEVVDRLYRRLRDEGEERILPLVMDLADPSPARGWRGVERAAFFGRSRPDLVLALALVHHLAIGRNVPLPEVVGLLADSGAADVVVEFPTPEDPMVRRLLRNKREGTHDDYTLAAFEAALDSHFEVVRREDLPSGTRVCFHGRRR